MKDQFATYEIALALKELGFNEQCFAVFLKNKELMVLYQPGNGIIIHTDGVLDEEDDCVAPLWQQAIDFLWTEKGILVNRNLFSEGTMYWQCGYNFFTEDELELAILKAIEISKKK